MRIALAVLFAIFTPAPCGAEGGDGTGPVRSAAKYFYVLPEGVQDEWAYAKHECEVITPALRRDLRNCIAFERHQVTNEARVLELVRGTVRTLQRREAASTNLERLQTSGAQVQRGGLKSPNGRTCKSAAVLGGPDAAGNQRLRPFRDSLIGGCACPARRADQVSGHI
jgi:hypothetical protein